MNAAIITARAGSKSIINKNIFCIGGNPLIVYPIQAAKDSVLIDKIYISTDGPEIAEVGIAMGCEIIWRPDELAGDKINHGDVIKHAVDYVEQLDKSLKNVVVLLGNTVMLDGKLIDQALAILNDRMDIDSVMTVWEAADDHPLRAMQIIDECLVPYGEPNRQVSTERQSYPKAYYYDQGPWAFRKECVQSCDGPNPWWWMGKHSFPIVRPWIAGRDIHTHFDVAIAEWWLENRDKVAYL